MIIFTFEPIFFFLSNPKAGAVRRSSLLFCPNRSSLRGFDPGDVPGTALQRGDAVLRTGVQRDDGAGCGAGVSTGSSFFLGRLMV